MDSAGSSDSVISMNSGYSEDSMDHLSAEERACLTYLEETIEALETQEDSGVSNDESHHESLTEKADQMRVNDISTLMPNGSKSDQKSFLSDEVPTAPPASTALATEGKTQLNQISEPQDSPLIPESSTHTKILSSAMQTEMSSSATNEDADPESVKSTIVCPGSSTNTSETDLSVIPPPLNFRDEPDSPSQPVKVKDLTPSVGISRKKPGPTFDLEQIRQRASVKKNLTSPVTKEPQIKPPPDESLSLLTSSQIVAPSSPESAEPKSPPVVAPKPKKLPPNIILKSHKMTNSDGNSVHPALNSSEQRPFLDPHKVRMEALRKLGLLKSSEEESIPNQSSKLPLKARVSWAAPSSSPPISPAAPNEPPSSQSYNLPPASVTVQPLNPGAILPSNTSTALTVLDPDILPAPADFSDPIELSPSENHPSAVKDATSFTYPGLVKQLTPPKGKSASLGRSEVGVSRYTAGQDFSEASQGTSINQNLNQLRNHRPRPASLGSRKEFSSAQAEGLEAGPSITKEPASQKALPAHTPFHHSRDTQKLPRSQGISVLICPRSENEEDRRGALKKLGLLRD